MLGMDRYAAERRGIGHSALRGGHAKTVQACQEHAGLWRYAAIQRYEQSTVRMCLHRSRRQAKCMLTCRDMIPCMAVGHTPLCKRCRAKLVQAYNTLSIRACNPFVLPCSSVGQRCARYAQAKNVRMQGACQHTTA